MIGWLNNKHYCCDLLTDSLSVFQKRKEEEEVGLDDLPDDDDAPAAACCCCPALFTEDRDERTDAEVRCRCLDPAEL